VVTNARVYYTPRAAAGATGTRLSLRPLIWEGRCSCKNSSASRRENAEECVDVVIASEAKQSISPSKERMDCFASLAMTVLWRSWLFDN
jgi:hypothetical protein